MRRHVRLHIALLLGLAVLAVSACTGSSEELVIYSGRGQNLIGPLLEQFHEQTGVDIAVRYGDSADLALLLAQEGQATPADVFLAQNPGAVAFVGDQGLLAELPSELLERVPARFRSNSNRWVGLSGRQRVVVYNRDLVDESDLPDSVFDLTEPSYRGRVAVAPPNGSFHDFVSAMRLVHGDDETLAWLEGLVANDVRTYPNNNAIVDAVSRGEVEMGLVNHYYNVRFLEEDPDLPSRNHRLPDGDIGALVIPSSISVLASSGRREAAERLVAFLLSQQAQEYFREATFEYPLTSGVTPVEGLPSLDSLETPDVDTDALGDELERTVELIERSGLSN
ncbi:MAG TPA: iron ABC transporter substrate-binding protein [Nitriliruptorales bacterium]